MKKWLLVPMLCLCILPSVSRGQGCAVCTKTASELDSHSARGLNGGILYLAFLPLGILGSLGFMWWRHTRQEQ